MSDRTTATNTPRSPTLYAVVGLFANVVMVVVKIGAGVAGNSYALIADGVESVTDLFASAVVWRGLQVAARSPDDRFPFGYGKAESVAAAVVALGLMAAAVGIFARALVEWRVPHAPPAPFTLVVLLAVVIAKWGLSRWVASGGMIHGSPALAADAWHHRADAITSGAAFLGIGIAVAGGANWSGADEIAAMVASLVIVANGMHLMRGAVTDLMDAAPGVEVVDRVRNRASSVSGVLAIEKVMARRMGSGYRVVLHVEADGEITLHEAHELGGRVRSLLREDSDILDVVVHMEPWSPTPPPPLPPER